MMKWTRLKRLPAIIALYQELVPRKLNWLSRYPALERYVELQVFTKYVFSVTLLFNSKWLRLGNYICETCNCTAHAFPLLQRWVLKAYYWFRNYSWTSMCEKSSKVQKRGRGRERGRGETRKVKTPLSPFSSLPGARPLDSYKQVTCASSPKRPVWMVALESLDRVNLYCVLAVNCFSCFPSDLCRPWTICHRQICRILGGHSQDPRGKCWREAHRVDI